MPKSKSKRRKYVPPPKPKPPPSSRWVPILFFTGLGLGFTIILARYMLGERFAFLNYDYYLWVGLGLIGAAFIVSTRWR